MSDSIQVILKEVELKKHSVRFNCKDASPAVTSIYISKDALVAIPDAVKNGVKITIEEAK